MVDGCRYRSRLAEAEGEVRIARHASTVAAGRHPLGITGHQTAESHDEIAQVEHAAAR